MADNSSELGLGMQGGFLQPLPPNADPRTIVGVLNDVINHLNDQLRTQVYSDGMTKRMLFGYQENGWGTGKHFGIKISEDGVDVTTASATQLIFSMDMDTWRWFEEGDRNYVNIGKDSTGSYSFEMAKPGETLDDPA